MKISASLMCADHLHLKRDLSELESAGIDFWHIDIMNGVFVPNLAMNFDTVKAIKGVSQVPMDAHLMVTKPENFLDLAAEAGVDYFSFHIEQDLFLSRTIKQISSLGMKPGIAINPSTSLDRVPYVLELVDLVVVMTVEPGFAGQKFIDTTLPKITQLKQMIEDIKPSVEIQVDGNINVVNAQRAIASGADILVGGTSSIFHDRGTLAENLAQFKEDVLAKN